MWASSPRDALTGSLDRVRPRLPAGLVSPGAISRLLAVSDVLPAALTHGFYLECRLGAGARVDLVVSVDGRGRDILAGTDPAVRLAPGLRAHPYWAEVQRLCEHWADPASPLAARVQGAWLEFDSPGGPGVDAVPLPGTFLKLAPDALAGAGDGVEELVSSLPGLPPDARLARGVRRCLGRLPEGARASYLGSFAARGTSAVRVCVVGLREEEVPAYLRSVGWGGSPAALERLFREVGTSGGRRLHPGPGMLHLDVDGDAVHPRIGLEYVLERGGQIRGELREVEFLDRLVELGLCTREKKDGLLAWPGYTFEDFAHELWPSLVKRRVNHVKLVCGEGRPAEAKAYLCVFSQFHRRGPKHQREESHGRAEAAAV